MNDRRDQSVSPSNAATPTTEARLHEDVQELVDRTLAGDDAAFAELFERFRDKVYRISFRFTRDHDDAMDLLQTSFIKAHRALGSYRRESSLATWISRITTNVGLDWVRARKRQAKTEIDETLLVEDDLAAGGPGPVRPLGPAAAAENAELGEALRVAVAALSEKHRSVFVLHCVEGMSYKDIAQALEISLGTVMSRLFHARRYLRESLAPHLGEARVRTLLRERGENEPAPEGGRRRGRASS